MSIGVISIHENPLTKLLPELAEDSLAIAQQAQVQTLVREEKQQSLTKGINNTTQLVALDPPEVEQNGGDFHTIMTLALTRLAGLLGDMADGITIELQFKRDEIKQLLKDKLQTIAENEQRRKDAIAAEKAMEAHKNRAGLFGSVMNFVFAATEVISGGCMIAAGCCTFNPGLVAGGVCLVAAGALEIAAEIVAMTSDDDDKANALRKYAIGFLVAGIVMSTYGAGSAAGGAALSAKQSAKEGVEVGAETAVKQGGKKIASESAEKVAKESLEATTERLGERAAKQIAEEAVEATTKQLDEMAAKQITKETVEVIGKKTAEEASEAAANQASQQALEIAAKEALEKANKEALEKANQRALVKHGSKALGYGATASQVGNKGYEAYMAVQQRDYDYRAAQLDQEIAELGAALDATVQEQEYINKLIQLLQEQWTRAVAGPIEDAMKTLNQSIQERGGVSKRIAASMSV